MAKRRLLKQSVLGILGGGLWAATAQAAVTVESQMSIDGNGMPAVAAMTSRTTETIAGDRARVETQPRMTSGLVRAFMRSAVEVQVEIIRLDRDAIYRLDQRNKRYSEQSFADIRAQLARIESQSPALPIAFDDSRCEWSAARSDLAREGQGAVAGIDVEQWNVRTIQTCTDRETRDQCEVVLDMHLAVAPNGIANDEQRRYQQQYLQKLGLASGMGRAPEERARALLGRYGRLWTESLGKMRAIKGQPLKSEFALLATGAGCATGAVPAPSASQEGRGVGDVARDIASAEASTVVTDKTGRWRLGNLSGELVGRLLSNKKKPATQDASVAANDSGSRPLLRFTYEILAVENTATDAALFEIPSDFRPAE